MMIPGEIVKLWKSPIPIKVTFITPDAVQYEDEDGCYECMDYELHPIPLTPEILKKNGFINGEFYAELLIGDWQIMSDCSHLASRSSMGWFIDIPCEYVHELQHALRLCGINKEIQLN